MPLPGPAGSLPDRGVGGWGRWHRRQPDPYPSAMVWSAWPSTSFDACSTPCWWPQNIPWPPCSPDRPGDDDTNTEPDNPTTDGAKTNDHDLRLQ